MKKRVIVLTLIKIPKFCSGITAISTSCLIIFFVLISFVNNFKAKLEIFVKIMKYDDVLRDKNHQGYVDYLKKL
jgi:1-acyl-sn-glycerol-3-phosphate acyltransferase